MPLQELRKINSHTCLGLWQLTETPEELLPLLPPQANLAELERLTRPTRRAEWLAARVLAYKLLEQLNVAPLPILKDEFNKPYFEGNKLYISLSHAGGMVAAMVSDKQEVGIDIELRNPDILKFGPKFLNAMELLDAGTDSRKAMVYWAVKEVLYKLYSFKKVTVRENLLVAPFGLEEKGLVPGFVRMPERNADFLVHYENLKDHVLAYNQTE